MVHKNCDTLCCSECFVLQAAHFLAAYDVVNYSLFTTWNLADITFK